jgi:hypothetical protein
MRTPTALAALLTAVLIGTASFIQVPAFAEAARTAQLHLRVVDSRNTALPAATVTIYTLDGNPGVTVTADASGLASFAAVSTGLTQVVTKSPRFATAIDRMTLHAGDNVQTITLQLEQTE